MMIKAEKIRKATLAAIAQRDAYVNSTTEDVAEMYRKAADDMAALGEAFFTRLAPTPLQDPHWVAADPDVAALLGLSPEWMGSEAALAVFSGNALLQRRHSGNY